MMRGLGLEQIMDWNRSILCIAAVAVGLTSIPQSPVIADEQAEPRRPNIIVIMADDLGYGDVGCYGAKPERVKTPHMDRLAKNGLQFTSGYCSASTCTPTRYSFLTGTYAFRKEGTGIASPNSPALIQPGTVTLPALLRKAGYRTAVIGKWHLGLGVPGVGPQWNGELKPGPLEIGFDYSFLLPTTNDRVPQVYVRNHRVPNLAPADPLWVGHRKPAPDHPTGITHRDSLKMDWSHGHNSTIHNGISRIWFYTGGHAARFRDEDLADKWVEESEQWITDNKDTPFFLFFASHDIHVPRMPHERFHGQSGMGFRGDAIVAFDWCVGELVRILKEQGLEENTLIVLCSDNGPVLDDGYKDGAVEKLGDHLPAGPYSGGKYRILEGGTRTPFITCWPGTIKPGVSEQIVCTIDLATSLATYLGVSIPQDACLDSLDVMSALLGKNGAKGRDNLIQQDNGNAGKLSSFGYRAGKWKLQRKAGKKKAGFEFTYTLYDLDADPAESRDIAEQHPEVFERMKAELQKLLDDGRSRVGGRG
jgi:arylsulfatase A-like enzyme